MRLLAAVAEFVSSDAPLFDEQRIYRRVDRPRFDREAQAEAAAYLEMAARDGESLKRFTLIASATHLEEHPTFNALESRLEGIQQIVLASVLLAFLPAEQIDAFDELGAIVDEYRNIVPLHLAGVSFSSPLKVTIEGDADEIAKLLGGPKQGNWQKRLMRGVALVCGTGIVFVGGDRLMLPLHQPAPAIRRIIYDACSDLPPGSEITFKTDIVDVAVPCRKTPRRASH